MGQNSREQDEKDKGSAADAHCEEMRALIPAYSMGLTDAAETRLVEARLRECPDAADELRSYHQLGAGLLAAVPPVTPPPALWDKLAAKLDEPAAPGAQIQPREVNTRTHGVELPHRSRAGMRRVLLSAAAALVVALLISNTLLLFQLNSVQTELQQTTVQLSDRTLALDLLWSSNLNRLALAPAEGTAADRPVGTVLWSPDTNTAIIFVRRFPQQAAGRAYQVWLISSEALRSPGLFEVDPNGNAIFIFQGGADITRADAVGITEEPAGGSPEPTSAPIVAGLRAAQ